MMCAGRNGDSEPQHTSKPMRLAVSSSRATWSSDCHATLQPQQWSSISSPSLSSKTSARPLVWVTAAAPPRCVHWWTRMYMAGAPSRPTCYEPGLHACQHCYTIWAHIDSAASAAFLPHRTQSPYSSVSLDTSICPCMQEPPAALPLQQQTGQL